jgi:hypothetical protein
MILIQHSLLESELKMYLEILLLVGVQVPADIISRWPDLTEVDSSLCFSTYRARVANFSPEDKVFLGNHLHVQAYGVHQKKVVAYGSLMH